jgi:twinkle protein
MMNDSDALKTHEPCPDCGSSDALTVYSDSHTHCFSCGKTNYPRKGRKKNNGLSLISGTVQPLTKRKISEETCQKWGYSIGTFNQRPCQIANYRDKDGTVVAQKIRLPSKEFLWTGSPAKVGLYGQHLWRSGGKMLVITEGEIDALTVSQLQGNKWPVVSVPNGAQSAKADLAKCLDYVEKFEQVVLVFDNDDPGNKAAVECAHLFTPGKVRIAKLPLKDPNEMLQEGRGKEVIDAIWSAPSWRPDGIIGIDEVIEEAKKPVQWGRTWPWETLTKLTYGTRFGEIYALGAGVGAGKTDVFTQWISHSIRTYPEPVGVIYLEQPPVETAKRIAGKIAGKPFHVPDGPWTKADLDSTLDSLRSRILLYNHFGVADWDVINTLIRHMALSSGAKHIYLDHLTALTAHASDERRELDRLMAEMSALAQNLNISIFFVSHLATPDGTPHEEGGRVMARHFKGSRSIMQWSHFMFGLERNQQASDERERRTAIFRTLKDRNTGQANGKTFALLFDQETGLLNEWADCPFGKEDEEDPKQQPSTEDQSEDF